jgi:acetyltransferase
MKDDRNRVRRSTSTAFEIVGGRPPSRELRLAATGLPATSGEPVRTRDGRVLLLRDIRRDDVEALRRGFAHLSAEEVRMRFLHPMTDLTQEMARQLCDIDPEHAVALVLVDSGDPALAEIHAVARAYIDAVTLAAEFALVVQRSLSGEGLGTLLMNRLIERCRARGAIEIWGDVLAENALMLELCDHLGFERHAAFEEPGVARVTLAL